MKLNLGCGHKRPEGFVNVDKYGSPDVKWDLECFRWPWDDSSVEEIWLIHALEHLGQSTECFLGIMQELYRISQPDAKIRIIVPHFRHDTFLGDPTHVRIINPQVMSLFSKKNNEGWVETGAANSTLALYLEVDFEITQVIFTPDHEWERRNFADRSNMDRLLEDSVKYNNVIEQIEMFLRVVK